MQSIPSSKYNVHITPLSDRSVLLSFGNTINEAINERVLWLYQMLKQTAFDGFIESVPAYASLAVFYDVQTIRKHHSSSAFAFVRQYLLQLLQQEGTAAVSINDIVKIPACYDPAYGIDIDYVAGYHRLSIPEIIMLHTSAIYKVYMIGFLPGFAYMGSVAEKLITPRKDQPRLQVDAGSIGIAGAQTGIYPIDSPGGWQIIGKTPLRLFDAGSSKPCLLSAGDQVKFVAISKNEFENYHVH